ncbi:MAG: DUF4190 domain-containing protein [Eubacteriales bacterium]|jgi:hypothetical protein
MDNQNPNQKSNGKAIASLVLGIISIVFIFTGSASLLGIVAGIVGLIIGISAKKEAPSGMATAGIVLSVIGLALCAVAFLACVACVGALGSLAYY